MAKKKLQKKKDDRGFFERLGDQWLMWRYNRIRDKCELRDNLKLKVELGKHKVESEYVVPDRTEKAWNEDTFYNGNIFAAGKAQPLKWSENLSKRQMVADTKYKSYMNNKLVSDIVSASTEDDTLVKMMMVAVVALMVVLGVSLFQLFSSMGMI